MKKQFLVLTGLALLLTGCGTSTVQTGTAPVTEVSEAEPEMPDLSAVGIDTGSFRRTDSVYKLNEGNDYLWRYDGEPPAHEWIVYKNDAGDSLMFDSEGRFRRYMAKDGSMGESAQFSAEEYREIGTRALQAVSQDFDSYKPDEENTIISKNVGSVYYPCEMFMTRAYAEGCKDILYASLKASGEVRLLESSFCDVTDEAETAQIDEVAMQYINSHFDNADGGIYIHDRYFVRFGDTLYGYYVFYVTNINSDTGEEYPTVLRGEGFIFRNEMPTKAP